MKNHTTLYTALVVFFSLILSPADALAWGAGVHLTLGARLLTQLHTLPLPLQSLLAA
ncbi:MAG: hypothetical protein GW875_10945, partial [Deltaproteobacteria bacterium]|nr:hypothetical protein [Deltaproteobacteria bacterium]